MGQGGVSVIKISGSAEHLSALPDGGYMSLIISFCP